MKKMIALVTGASRGIGKSITVRMKSAGIKVLTPTRHELDLSSNLSIDEFISNNDQKIDILVNNAGINRLGGYAEVSENDIQDTLQINLIAPMRLINLVAPKMIESNFGRIVNISSIFSIVTKERRITYSSSKSALNGMTRALAIELAKFNILINSVAPGYVNTDLTKKNNSENELNLIKESIPIKRLAETEEIAELVYFLCSEKNTYLTGQTIVIDGGFTCQ